MTRINLLPEEVVQKRKREVRVFQVIAAILALLVILSGLYAILVVSVRNQESKLSDLRAENKKLNESISEYKVYEQRKETLQKQESIISTALTGEVDWHKILNEMSMVIPSDVWLEEFSGDVMEGITCKGYAIDYDFDTPDLGHKPVAEWIVRLGEVKAFTSIWLSFSQKTTFLEKPAIQFELTTQLEGEKPASAPAVPPN